MIPPPGYRFVPKQQHVCGQAGCFECYDIWCERCESKDRRILELEMRNNELVKHITLLQAKLFPRAGMGSPGPGGVMGQVQSPMMFDPSRGTDYTAATTFQQGMPAPR